MTLLIATDEAGYGPKLGPLVIVATAWRMPAGVAANLAFSHLSNAVPDPRCGDVFVDDSKRVFNRHQVIEPGQASMLEIACRAASQWASLPDPAVSFCQWLETVAKSDFDIATKAPWFATWSTLPKVEQPKFDFDFNANVIAHWMTSGLELLGIHARFITAAAFNSQVERGMNKADILTEATCRMAVEMIDDIDTDELEVTIESDRHGGRAYYGSAIQHLCDARTVQVVNEGKAASRYHLTVDTQRGKQRRIDWSFSVGGDSSPPVALSSMVAKWLRERAMLSFNQYFAARMPPGVKLRPTAGYPSDADRFVTEIRTAGLCKDLPNTVLIRVR